MPDVPAVDAALDGVPAVGGEDDVLDLVLLPKVVLGYEGADCATAEEVVVHLKTAQWFETAGLQL